MAISFPAPETAAKGLDTEARQRPEAPTLIANAGRLLKRGYERACSAILDAEGDCMRF